MPKTTPWRQNITADTREWFVVDASKYRVGHIASVIAVHLRGKHRVDFTPHSDGGAYVVVLNADKVQLSGNKGSQKMYYRHSGYLGNLKSRSADEMRVHQPINILQHAVKGMLPKTKHRSAQLLRLRLVAGDDNPHLAQASLPLPIN